MRYYRFTPLNEGQELNYCEGRMLSECEVLDVAKAMITGLKNTLRCGSFTVLVTDEREEKESVVRATSTELEWTDLELS